MQWFAYFIWGALGLCFLVAILVYLYARFLPKQQVMGNDNSGDVEKQDITFDDRRWQVLLNSTPFVDAETPSGTADKVEWATDLLGVEPLWFAGGDEPMFPYLSFHNNVAASVDFIRQRMQENKQLRLYVVKPQGIELTESAYDACVVLCFAAPVSYAGKQAWRYWPVNVYWEWGYEPEQMQCRQIIYVAVNSGCEVVGVELDINEIHFLLESKLIPEPLYRFSPQPTSGPVQSQWDAIKLANAGEPVMGQCESTTLSDEELKQLIKQGAGTINAA